MMNVLARGVSLHFHSHDADSSEPYGPPRVEYTHVIPSTATSETDFVVRLVLGPETLHFNLSMSFRDEDYRRLFSLPEVENEPSRWIFEYEHPNRNLQYLKTPWSYKSINTMLVVFVDGACVNNGRQNARGGYGVYFGSNSEYNVSSLLKPDTPQISQRAELIACLVALNQIERVAQDVTFTPPLKGVLITTDSAYLVNSMTKYIYKWRENGYTAATGSPVVNRDLFHKIDRKLDAMEFGRQQIPVLFWKVDRSDNEDADELAKDAVYS